MVSGAIKQPAPAGGSVTCRYTKECMITLLRLQPRIPVSYMVVDPGLDYGSGMLIPLTQEEKEDITSKHHGTSAIKVSGHLKGVYVLTEKARGTPYIETLVRFRVVDDDGKPVRYDSVNGYDDALEVKETTTFPEEALKNHKKWEDEAVRLAEDFRKNLRNR